MEQLLFLGLAIIMASGLMFNYRLHCLNTLLQNEYPALWKKFGSGNRKIHSMAKLYRLRSLATEYTSEDKQLKYAFSVFTYLQLGSLVGAGFIVIAIVGMLFG